MVEPSVANVLQLTTERERKALAGLKHRVEAFQEQFTRLILRQLWMIRIINLKAARVGTFGKVSVIHESQQNQRLIAPPYSVPKARLRELVRLAKSAQGIADKFSEHTRALERFDPFLLLRLPKRPIKELQFYADSLSSEVRFLEQSSASSKSRHHADRRTPDIVALVKFVEEGTGKPRWNSLAILLAAALEDESFNAERLRGLVKYHSKRRKKWQAGIYEPGALRRAAKRAAERLNQSRTETGKIN